MTLKSSCPTGVAMDLWQAFVEEADKVRRTRNHYSARTLIEYIRHHRQIKGGTPYTVNNCCQVALSEAYMKLRRCPDFFERRHGEAA